MQELLVDNNRIIFSKYQFFCKDKENKADFAQNRL